MGTVCGCERNILCSSCEGFVMGERNVFGMLWKMYHELQAEDDNFEKMRDDRGMIISRYAGIIDDRIENSGYSRSVDSLKLYDTKQLQEELNSRKASNVST